MPKIIMTEAAQAAIKRAAAAEGDAPLRLAIDARFNTELYFDQRTPVDEDVHCGGGVSVILDAETAQRADGMTIDFVERGGGSGFKIENPNAPARVEQISARQLKEMFESGTPLQLIDVRTQREWEIARIPRARLLDQTYQKELLAGDRGVTLVFHCHHGLRSQAAAEHFRTLGFRKLYNLAGGIDAWSEECDPSVPRY